MLTNTELLLNFANRMKRRREFILVIAYHYNFSLTYPKYIYLCTYSKDICSAIVSVPNTDHRRQCT